MNVEPASHDEAKIVPAVNRHLRTCLLILQRSFHAFEKHIKTELESLGYRVTVANDEYPESTLGKVLGKLQVPLVFALTERVVRERFISGHRYDIVIIIKGRGISPELIDDLRAVTRGPIVGYNWDTFQFNSSPLRWLSKVHRYLTFDYRDAERHQLKLAELFSAAPKVANPKQIEYDVSFIGRNHAGRLRHLDEVLRALKPTTKFVAIFEPNFITLLLNAFRNPRLHFKYRRNIVLRPIRYEDYCKVIRASAFTIDWVRASQTGITMRCFEAISMGTKIITNNPYIQRSSHFDRNDYVVTTREMTASQFREEVDRKRQSVCTSRPRSVKDFVAELVDDPSVQMMGYPPSAFR